MKYKNLRGFCYIFLVICVLILVFLLYDILKKVTLVTEKTKYIHSPTYNQLGTPVYKMTTRG
jgi:hypothetical protein